MDEDGVFMAIVILLFIGILSMGGCHEMAREAISDLKEQKIMYEVAVFPESLQASEKTCYIDLRGRFSPAGEWAGQTFMRYTAKHWYAQECNTGTLVRVNDVWLTEKRAVMDDQESKEAVRKAFVTEMRQKAQH